MHTAICIKAIYSQNAHCKAFLGRKFLSSKILMVFDFVLQKSSDVNKDCTCKDKDQAYKDQDKD